MWVYWYAGTNYTLLTGPSSTGEATDSEHLLLVECFQILLSDSQARPMPVVLADRTVVTGRI